MNNEHSNLSNVVSRRDKFAFTQWYKSLPKEQTAFMYQTFDTDEVRLQKLQDLYKRYLTEKGKLPPIK